MPIPLNSFFLLSRGTGYPVFSSLSNAAAKINDMYLSPGLSYK